MVVAAQAWLSAARFIDAWRDPPFSRGRMWTETARYCRKFMAVELLRPNVVLAPIS